ncbi:MAG: hypothetical protein BMS9Abin39_0294 [Ignavibacteria bacterium]|nr:MAG: hypothetical protein BMS9Abin39_0294 [Ignavibacteria bacterium]
MIQFIRSDFIIEKKMILPLVLLSVLISVLLINYLLIGISAVILTILLYMYGERLLIGIIIVSLLTIVSDFGATIRLIVHLVNFVLLAFLFLKRYGFNFPEYPKIPRPIIIFLSFYYFSMIITAIFSQHFSAGVSMIVRQTIFFIIAYIFFSFIRDIKDVRTIIVSLIFVSMIIALSSIYEFSAGGFNLVNIALGIRYRIANIVGNPLKASTFFILTLPLVFTFIFSGKYKHKSTLLLSVSAILMIGLFLIISRSAVFVIFLSVMFILAQLNKEWFKKFIFIMIITTLMFFLIEPLYKTISLFFQIKFGLSQRDYFWAMALHVIQDNPLLGIGPGSFRYEVFNYSPVLLDSWPGRVIIDLYMATEGENPSHNLFLKFASDMGIPGVITILYFMVQYFKIAAKTLRKAKDGFSEYFLIILAISAAAGSMFVRGLFDSIGIVTYGIITSDLPFWLMFSILIFFYQKPKEYFTSDKAKGTDIIF